MNHPDRYLACNAHRYRLFLRLAHLDIAFNERIPPYASYSRPDYSVWHIPRGQSSKSATHREEIVSTQILSLQNVLLLIPSFLGFLAG